MAYNIILVSSDVHHQHRHHHHHYQFTLYVLVYIWIMDEIAIHWLFILWNAAYWFPALKWSFSETVSVFIMLFLWDNAYDSLPCKNYANNSKIKAFLYRGTIPSKLGNWLWSTKDQPNISSWFNLYWKSFTNMLVYILSRTILLYYIHFAVYYLWLHNTSRKRDWIQYILTQDCNLKKKIAYFTLVPAFNLFYHLFLPKSKE